MKDLPFYQCPRYSSCNVNSCPLHPQYPNMPIDPEDPEKRCTIAKSIRVRISAQFPGMLRYDGLSPREFSAKERWNSLSPEEQEERRNNAKTLRARTNPSARGVSPEMTYKLDQTALKNNNN